MGILSLMARLKRKRPAARKNSAPSLTVSICGSYNKHLRMMGNVIKECRELGIRVRIPRHAVRKFSTHRFVYLKGETGTPRQLQDNNFGEIRRSSFLYVVNPKGYIGTSTAMEIGYAISAKIPIFCTERPREYIFRFYTVHDKTLPEIKSMFVKKYLKSVRRIGRS